MIAGKDYVKIIENKYNT